MSLAKISPGNQPDRLYLNSDDALDFPVKSNPSIINQDTYSYNSFVINLAQPILGCDGVQLASFVQPNCPADGPCVPDYQASFIGFCYYKSAAPGAPAPGDLKVLYLLASSSVLQSSPNTIPDWINRYYVSYQDFVDVLNNAAVAMAAGPLSGPDVEFTYDTVQRRICFRGLDNTKYYMSAGYSDSAVVNWIASQVSTYGWADVPYGYTLNQRVGFCEKSYILANQKQGGSTATSDIYPLSFPNLVRTGSITLRTNFNYQAGLNSKDNRDLLATIPVSVPFLGVNDFQYNLNHYLANVPETVQQLQIRMFDDQGQPYPVSNNAATQIECLLTYGGQKVVQ